MPRKLTIDELIYKFNIKHKNKYDYSLIKEYEGSLSKIPIICNTHGIFYQRSSDHMSGCGCQKCDPTNSIVNDEFIKRSNLVHDNKYQYLKSIYGKSNYDHVIITCENHGDFSQTPWAHMRGQGCPKCCNNTRLTNNQFIERGNEIHNFKYNYSLVEYTNKNSLVKIICEKHGVFLQKSRVHLSGHGCKLCRSSKLEKYVKDFLDIRQISYEFNKRFENCRNSLPLPFDFYLQKYNLCIECDGIQHFKPIKHFGGEERFQYQIENDDIKTKYCSNNNINLLRINTNNISYELEKLEGVLISFL